MVFITIVTGAYKSTYNWVGPHCRELNHDNRDFSMKNGDLTTVEG